MFKLESYVTPLLMGYIDKYVKLKPEDLQVSLWGGDIVLNKLDLRLDAIEEAIKLPVTFKSGHIHELRIHVPWTKLGSEPVVITINTIECVLKLRDTAYHKNPKSNTAAKTNKPKLKPNAEELPPGYLQSMINRIVNNFKIVVNNLILKFVEDDIVLSLNVKSAECYSADKTWSQAFIDLAPPELVMRKVIDFHDLTVCLDKRDASGKIENYQDPSLYRCSMTCRSHMCYDSLHSKLPSVTKVNILCENLEVSLTDTQLPMFWRLVELFLAIYYGVLELPEPDRGQDGTKEENGDSAIESQSEAPTPEVPSHEEEQASWAGWAWSFVPQVLPTESGSEEGEQTPMKKTPPILAVGIYCSHASLIVKQTEHVQESRFYGPQKIVFKPFACLEVHGIAIDVLLEGLEFLNAQFGIISGRVYSIGDCTCGAREEDCPPKSAVFFQSGPQDVSLKDHNFMSESLFDDKSPENTGRKPEFIFDVDHHKQVYTESWALNKFGALWGDYLYTMDDKGEQHIGGSYSSVFEGDETVRESSSLSFLIGASHLAVSSAMLHRCQKFVYASLDHEYEPYAKIHEEIVNENRTLPTEEQVEAMERHVNTRTTHLTLISTTISILAADHPYCDIKNRKYVVTKKSRRESKTDVNKPRFIQPLPAILLQSNRFDLQLTKPMYPRRLVKFVSKMADPSSNLVHHCHTHMYIKVFGLQGGLYRMDQAQPSMVCLFPQCSGAFYQKTLILPIYWSDPDQTHVQQLYELPNFKAQTSHPQLLLLGYIIQSWTQQSPNPQRILELSLLEDVFTPRGQISATPPVLDGSISCLDLRISTTKIACQLDGTLGKLNACVRKFVERKEQVYSILQGPVDTRGSHSPEFFTTPSEIRPKHRPGGVEVLTLSSHLPLDLQNEDVPSIVVFDLQGIVASLDPVLYEWLSYHPQQLASPRVLVQEPVPVPTEGAEGEKHGSKASQRTGSNATVPTDSQSRTQTRSVQPKSKSDKKRPQIEEVALSVGEQVAAYMPLIRKLSIQVEIQHCCCLFPTSPLQLANPGIESLTNLKSLCANQANMELLVLCLPEISLYSAGHKRIDPGQELPIGSPELLATGDRLPWTLKMSDWSIYTLHPNQAPLTFLKPLSLTCTLAITRKYSGKDHKELKSLGFCVHIDLESMVFGVSNQQVIMMYKIMQRTGRTATILTENLAKFHKTVFPKVIKKSLEKKESVPEEKSSPSKPAEQPTESSQLLESSDPQDTVTEDQSTRELRPIGEILTESPTSSTIQLSLWMQWTLPKFLLRLFRVKPNGKEMCISTDLEDLTASIDVQEVYCKVKSKVGALNISHYEKNKGSWVSGPHAGVLISTSDKLSKNVSILNNKSWNTSGQPLVSFFNIQDFKPRDSSHGFLSLTFTRALRKSVQKKLKKLAYEDDVSETENDLDLFVKTYVDEICLSTQPFDAVIQVPIMLHLIETFSLHDEIESRDFRKSAKVEKANLPVFQSDSLPLFYLNMANIRVFVPLNGNGESIGEKRTLTDSTVYHDMYVFQVLSVCLTPQPENPLPRSPVNQDLYRKLLAAGLSQNPGSEVEDRQYQLDLCGLGLCTGLWDSLETGQNQSMSFEDEEVVGVQNPALEWNNLMTKSNDEDIHLIPIATSVDLRIVAAPALVHKSNNTCMKPELVCGYSLEVNAISDIDFTVSTNQMKLLADIIQSNVSLLSPKTRLSSQSEDSFQADQSKSFYDISERSVEITLNDSGVGSEASTMRFQSAKPSAATAIESKLGIEHVSKEPSLNSSSRKMDARSGESDRDVTLLPHSMDITKEKLTVRPRRSRSRHSKIQPGALIGNFQITPFDVLLTAGKITFIAYTHLEVKKSEIRHNSRSERSESRGRRSKIDLELHTDGENWRHELTQSDEYSSGSFVGSDMSITTLLPTVTPVCETLPNLAYLGSLKPEKSSSDSDYVYQTLPFLFANFSQPHTVVNVKGSGQKVELSCYDFTLKGSKEKYVIQDECRVLPDFSDFQVAWLETRPGDPNPKTGIPPSLYTFRVTDFLQMPANIFLSLERPLKVSLSTTKMQKATEFLERLQFSSGGVQQEETHPDTKPTGRHKKMTKLIRQYLGQVANCQLKTVQVVVVMETPTHSDSPQVTLATSGIHGEVDISSNTAGQANTIVNNVLVKELQCLTSWRKTSRPFIGPLTFTSTVTATWCEHSGPSWLPKVVACAELGAFDVLFGQEHFVCVEQISQHWIEYFQKCESATSHEKKRHASRSRGKKSPQRGATPSFKVMRQSVDDLRRGAFQYIMEEVESTMHPNPNEVIFCNDDDGQCTMTWSYQEPRMLTKFHVTPVPFNIEVDDDISFVGDESLKVGCVLQYWDSARRDFLDWVEFYLSEQESTEVALPDIETPSKIVVAQIWRVSMDAQRDKSELSCDLDEDDLANEPIVLPATLAASLRVDSAVICDLIPIVQLNLSMDLLRCRLQHHLQHFAKDSPKKLRPFFLSENFPKDQEFAQISLNDLQLSASHCYNHMTNISGEITAECDILEYRHLIMRPVVESCTAKGEVLMKHFEKQPPQINIGFSVSPVFFYVGQATLHTVDTALQVWKNFRRERSDTPIMAYYLICNDTQESIKFGQVGTDECVTIQCREALQYCWRSHKVKPLLRLSLDGSGWLWSEPIKIDENGCNVRVVEWRDRLATLTIKVTQLTGTIKQVIIRGQLLVSNRLNQHLEIKVVTHNPSNHRLSILGARQTVASYVTESNDVKALKVKVMAAKTPWTNEIPITGDKMKESRLVKIATSDKGVDLHAWCHIFCQHLLGDATKLVVFTPVYVVKSHLPHPVLVNISTPKLQMSQQLQVSGRCEEEQLTTLQADLHHEVTFQIRQDSSPSKPPVSISLRLLDQVKSPTTEKPEVDTLAYGWDSESKKTWFGYQGNSELDETSPATPTPLDQNIDHSDLDLQVKFNQYWPGCNTVAMELVPWCLIRNESAVNLVIQEEGGKDWRLKKGTTWAPPKFACTIKLGIQSGPDLSYSNPISFSDKDTRSSHYLPHIEGVLYKDAHTFADIYLQGERNQVCYLVLKSTIQDSIQCVTIRERFLLTNLTNAALDLSALAVPLNKKTPVSSIPIQENHIPADGTQKIIMRPLTYFTMPESAEKTDQAVRDDLAQYVRMKHRQAGKQEELEGFSEFRIREADLVWSTPVRLKPTNTGARVTLSVPLICGGCYTTKSYTLAILEKDGLVYMVLDVDSSPAMMLHNFTDTPLHYGQTQVNLSIRGVSILEDSAPLHSLPLLPPGGSVCYTFPWQSEQYPQLDKQSYRYMPKLHLSGVAENEDGAAAWSTGIDFTSGHDNILNIPNTLDVKIHTELQCFTKHIYIEEVGRAEVTAKEIRNRIIGHETVVVMETSREKKESTPDDALQSDVDNVLFKPLTDGLQGLNQEVVISSSQPDQMVAHTPLKFKHQKHWRTKSPKIVAHALLRHVCVIMVDDTATEITSEVLRLILNNVFIIGYPSKPSPHEMSVIFSVNRAQVDNQMYPTGGYDFPVVLHPQEEQKEEDFQIDFEEVLEFLKVIKGHSFVWLKFQIDQGIMGNGSQITSAELAVKPVSLFIEDNYIYDMLKRIDAFIPTSLTTKDGIKSDVLPKSVECVAQCFLQPIRLEHLIIQPISMCLSVHASLKLFLASENTPLKFGKFEKQALLTNNPRLIRALTMHYASAALFRAGLVVGSLEILGNPTGLVRNISSGVVDLLRMPLEGLTKGPGSFLSGITHGFSSLLWHTSTGTLTSITNFASSVSRNMDRLSMDNDHFYRQEETRRQRPDRLTTGLKQGLTGFGISLLGAVAGLADQPLQGIQQASNNDRPTSSTQKAAGFISGVGKGLIGVVTKPVGGAAEFVSQTGQGLLHGAGMAKLSKTVYPSMDIHVETSNNATLKFLWKILQTIPSTDILCILEATSMSSVGPVTDVYLLLTPETVFMVNVAEDTALQAFAVREMECRRRTSEPDTLLVHLLNKKEEKQLEKNESAKDRVAEFVGGETDSDAQVSDLQSETSSDIQHLSVARYEFRTHPKVLEIFLAHLHLAKRLLDAKGFPL